jgi:hypothetical protein
MCILGSQDRIPGAGECGDRALIGHGSRGDEESGLLSEELRGPLLQAVDAGIFSIDVIAGLGGRHDLAHFCRGLGDRIASQINQCDNRLYKNERDNKYLFIN